MPFIYISCRHISPDHSKSVSTDNLAGALSESNMPRGGYDDWGGQGEYEALYVPEVEEIRVSPVVARKGYLNFLHDKSNGWIKKFVVSMIWWVPTLCDVLGYILFYINAFCSCVGIVLCFICRLYGVRMCTSTTMTKTLLKEDSST